MRQIPVFQQQVFNQFYQRMADSDVGLLDAACYCGRHNQGQIAFGQGTTTITARQANRYHSLFTRCSQRPDHVWRFARCGDSDLPDVVIPMSTSPALPSARVMRS